MSAGGTTSYLNGGDDFLIADDDLWFWLCFKIILWTKNFHKIVLCSDQTLLQISPLTTTKKVIKNIQKRFSGRTS
uniref:Uncharacterized protein n=1 Tax=Cannabis sativa TaxID=3483 RepID=A0A803R992_CANSA